MKVSDYIAKFLVELNIKHAFVYGGGATIHLIDSIAKTEGIDYICPQHEEQGAMAADSYSRTGTTMGVAIATSGPGATNLLTGVCCSYFDFIPTLLLTGQVVTGTLKGNKYNVRQIGFQETDIVGIFNPVTKYAKQIRDANDIKYILEEAVYYAIEGLPGPVLVDIPDDIQRAEIEPDKLKSFIKPKVIEENNIDTIVLEMIESIKVAKRPVVIVGAGVRISKSEKEIVHILEKLNIPVLLTWGAKDIMEFDHPINIGGFGTTGPRYGNFAIQNTDLIIAIGSRFSQMISGVDLSQFAPKAKKIIVDINLDETKKFEDKGLVFDVIINSSINHFISILNKNKLPYREYKDWYEILYSWKDSYPICPKRLYAEVDFVNSYVFIDSLSECSRNGNIIVTDAGGNLTWTMQTFKVKQDQRLFSAWNHSPMGYSLAGAIGASFANPNKDIICIIGDGGLQMCIEELATISKYKLPVKIFLMNNQGHGIMKQTIDTWLDGNYSAVNVDSGLYFPDFNNVAKSYGIQDTKIENHTNLQDEINKILNLDGPVFCNVNINPKQQIRPKLKFGEQLNELWPYIDYKGNI